MGAVANKTMTDVIIDLVAQAEVAYPTFMKPKKAKPSKKPQPLQPIKPTPEERIKKRILSLQAEGLGGEAIAKKLTTEKIPTFTGKKVWSGEGFDLC